MLFQRRAEKAPDKALSGKITAKITIPFNADVPKSSAKSKCSVLTKLAQYEWVISSAHVTNKLVIRDIILVLSVRKTHMELHVIAIAIPKNVASPNSRLRQ